MMEDKDIRIKIVVVNIDCFEEVICLRNEGLNLVVLNMVLF